MAPGPPDDTRDAPENTTRDEGTDDVAVRLRQLHEHLAATAELPVETGAGRWLGEAEAVASDVADGEAPPSAIGTRVHQVRELLSHVEGTGHEAANEHVATARELAAEIERAIDDEP